MEQNLTSINSEFHPDSSYLTLGQSERLRKCIELKAEEDIKMYVRTSAKLAFQWVGQVNCSCCRYDQDVSVFLKPQYPYCSWVYYNTRIILMWVIHCEKYDIVMRVLYTVELRWFKYGFIEYMAFRINWLLKILQCTLFSFCTYAVV